MNLRISPLTSAVLLAISSPALHAQTAASAHTDKAIELDSVDVHGTRVPSASTPKFTAPLIDTPRSVSVIPQAVIQETAATTLLEALRTVPGITFGAGEGGNPNGDRPFIRGFDSESSIFVDGVRSSGSQSRETFAVEQIEVTKGPSSAYTGRGSVGGSVNLVSKTAKERDFINGSIAVGTDNYTRVTADLNQMLGDSAAFRIAAMSHQNDIPDRGGPENKRWGIAPSLALGLSGDTSATISYYHLNTDNIPDSGLPYNNPNNNPSGSGRPINVPHDTWYGLFSRDFQKSKDDVGTIKIEHHFANSFVLRNTSVWGRTSYDYLWTQPDDSQGNFVVNDGVWRRANSRISQTTALTNQTDLSGQFSTGSILHNFSSGIEIANEETKRDSYTITPNLSGATANGACSSLYGVGAPSGYWCAPIIAPNPRDPWTGTITPANSITRVDTDTRSVWLFDTAELTKQWLLNVGVRWDSFETESTTGTTAPVKNDASFWNYQAGVVYKPATNGSIYVSWGTSSNPPGVDAGDGADGVALTNNDLKPERSKNIELGTKWDVLDGKASVSAAIFRTEKSNARVATGGRGSPQVNAGQQRVDGLELSISGSITERWTMFAGYTYLDSELVETGPAGAASKGNQFPNTPKNSATLWTTYALTPRLSIGGGAYYQDKVYGDANNLKWVPSYTRLDAMASYTVNHNLSLQLNVQNLTDKYYFDKAYAAHYVTVAPGRSAMLSLNFSFD